MRDVPHLHDSYGELKPVRLDDKATVPAATLNSLRLLRITITCACKPGRLLSLDWLHISDWETIHDKAEHPQVQAGVCRLTPVMLPAWEQGLVRAVLWGRAAF